MTDLVLEILGYFLRQWVLDFRKSLSKVGIAFLAGNCPFSWLILQLWSADFNCSLANWVNIRAKSPTLQLTFIVCLLIWKWDTYKRGLTRTWWFPNFAFIEIVMFQWISLKLFSRPASQAFLKRVTRFNWKRPWLLGNSPPYVLFIAFCFYYFYLFGL